MARKAKRKRGGVVSKLWHRLPKRRLVVFGSLAALVVLFWLIWPFLQATDRFESAASVRPSRLYGRPIQLATGAAATAEGLSRELSALGYRKVAGRSPAAPGEYRWLERGVVVYMRDHATGDGWKEGGLLDVEISRGKVRRMTWRGDRVRRAELEPPLLASYYGPDRAERRPVKLAELPEELIQAVLAAEDASFFNHQGVSLRGIARAAWVNLRRMEVQQGGSTVTQQLVKNLFLTHRRTVGRKVREAAIALLIDLRYSKEEILQTYLNEIYWGVSDSVNLIGVGSAAWAYFGKRAEDLDLCESTTIAGMIRSPGRYSPRRPEDARARRDWVLGRMAEVGWLDGERAAAESERQLCFSPRSIRSGGPRYFADAVTIEVAKRYGLYDLPGGGYSVYTTLEAAAQREAEAAVEWGLGALEKGWEKGRESSGPLQAALVSLDPRTGAVRAWVGGRDYGQSQFDRVHQAARQAGSAFKPVVYAAAFESGSYAPSVFVEDAPLTVARTGNDWRPQNSNGEFRGWVTVRTAVEDSLNVPTVRVAMDVGLDEVIRLARAMGVEGRLDPFPALALGAFEVTPLELATVYATVAGGGRRPPVHAVERVIGSDGREVSGEPLAKPLRALSAESAYLLTSVLEGVLERGTASGARHQGLRDRLAGKTGTTNDRRDSWFVGYSPERVSLVWVGYDDNSTTRLSGARAALPIWTKFTYATRPSNGHPMFEQPRGIVTAAIDPATGELATGLCPSYLTEVFREGHLPTRACHLHARGWDRWGRDGELRTRERPRRWEWLRKVFGKKKRDGG